MRAFELLEYKTKSGNEITFDISEDIEGDNNRGFLIDKITAYIDGDPVGYLKLGYIPRERFNRYYPTILNWLDIMEGKHLFPRGKEKSKWKSLSIEDKQYLLKRLSNMNLPFSFDREEQIDNFSEEELNQELKQAEQMVTKRFGKKFQNFKERFVDKPYEDYIKVFSKGDRINPRDSDSELASRDYKRQGIATAMYLKAVDFYDKRGLKMRLSTLRSREGGEAIGDALKAMGLTTKIGEFDFLDPKKVQEYVKERGLNEETFMERTTSEWEDLISRLEAVSLSPNRSPQERLLYRKKAEDLRKKHLGPQPSQKPSQEIFPDFDSPSPKRYTKTGEFEKYPFKTGTKYNKSV